MENKRENHITFVCEHGAAKSVIAAAYFNRFAEELGLVVRAVARGTHPDAELSPMTVKGLSEDGLAPAELVPRQLSLEEANASAGIVAFCELPASYQQGSAIERWEDVPPVSENYEQARDAIVEHLKRLIDTIRRNS